jgi:hypothetical protein
MSGIEHKGGKMANIEKFNLYVTKILTYLYSNIPVASDVNTGKFIKKEDMDEEIRMKYYEDDEAYMNLHMESDAKGNIIEQEEVYKIIFSDTMWWLKDEGFITFVSPIERPNGNHAYNSIFLKAVITNKGLAALEKEVLNDGKKRRLIDILKEAIINNSVGTLMNLPIMLYQNLNNISSAAAFYS